MFILDTPSSPAPEGPTARRAGMAEGRMVEAIATPGGLAITQLMNVTVTINISHWTQSKCIPQLNFPFSKIPKLPMATPVPPSTRGSLTEGKSE